MRLEIFSEDFLQIQPIDIFQSKQVLVYAKNICCFEEFCHLKKESHIKKFKAKGQVQNQRDCKEFDQTAREVLSRKYVVPSLTRLPSGRIIFKTRCYVKASAGGSFKVIQECPAPFLRQLSYIFSEPLYLLFIRAGQLLQS